jgi:hypothetical protein
LVVTLAELDKLRDSESCNLRIAVALTASLSSTAELAVSDLSIDASAVSLSETTEPALRLSLKLSSDLLDSESESLGLSQLTITRRG